MWILSRRDKSGKHKQGGLDPGLAYCSAIFLCSLRCHRRNLNDNKRDNLNNPELKMQPIFQPQRVY